MCTLSLSSAGYKVWRGGLWRRRRSFHLARIGEVWRGGLWRRRRSFHLARIVEVWRGRAACPLQLHCQMPRVIQRHQPGRLHHGDGGVVDAQPPERIQRAAQQVAGVDADDAAVRDDEDVLTIAMLGRDTLERRQHPASHCLQRLAARWRAIGRRPHPGPVRIAGAGPDLLAEATLPLPQGELAERRHGHDRRRGAGEGDLGGLAGPRQRAHVGDRRPVGAESPAEGSRLGSPPVREDDVGSALEPADLVPHGLAVPHQEQPHRSPRVTRRAAPRRVSVSSRPSSASTSNSGGEAVRPVTARRVSWARSTSLRPRASVSSR